MVEKLSKYYLENERCVPTERSNDELNYFYKLFNPTELKNNFETFFFADYAEKVLLKSAQSAKSAITY